MKTKTYYYEDGHTIVLTFIDPRDGQETAEARDGSKVLVTGSLRRCLIWLTAMGDKKAAAQFLLMRRIRQSAGRR